MPTSWRARSFAGLVAVAGALLLGALPMARADTKVLQTGVYIFTPAIPKTASIAGNCFSESIAADRLDAWRCFTGNFIHDPCFAAKPGATLVVCDADPIMRKAGIAVRLAKPLPAHAKIAGQQPWLLELADGAECNFFTGATGVVKGQRINYGCSDKHEIYGMPKAGKVYTVAAFTPGPGFTPQHFETIPLIGVWF